MSDEIIKPMEFRRYSNGAVYLLGEWESRALLTFDFVKIENPLVEYSDGILTITVANGRAVYRELWRGKHYLCFDLVDASLSQLEPHHGEIR